MTRRSRGIFKTMKNIFLNDIQLTTYLSTNYELKVFHKEDARQQTNR